MDLFDHVGPRGPVGEWINDDDIRNALLYRGSELLPFRGGDERMLRAKNNCEMRLELTRQVGDDVHTRASRMS
jgi:hypothetical protein